MVSTVVFLAIYLSAGFVMCWQMRSSPWWAPIAPALAVFGLFTLVPRNMWLRMTGQTEQADLEWMQAFYDQWNGGSI